MNRILVATDFSDSAGVAVEQAVAIARSRACPLLVVHAANVSGAEPDFFERITGRLEQFRRELRADLLRRRHRLEALRDEIARRGVDVDYRLLDGYPDEQLAKAAAELGADLLVVGTRRGVGPILLGSVAERVVRASQRPVLVARPPATSGGFTRILVGADFEEASDRALDIAVGLAEPAARVEVLHASTDPEVRTYGERLIAPHREAGVDIAFERQPGHTGQVILERLDETPRFDLVALGSHGHRGWRRWWLGSIAEAVLRYAPCSVLIVPPET